MAGAYGSYFGTKFYSSNPRYGAHFYFILYDSKTAQPLALMEANHLGQIRTGAASGYATDLMSNPRAETLGIIGSGFQARTQLDAMRAVRAIKTVRVWSRSEEKRRQFAANSSAIAVDSAEEAVRGSQIVVTATNSKDPVLESNWIEPGTMINAMGSNVANRRELPADLIQRADLIAADSIEQAKIIDAAREYALNYTKQLPNFICVQVTRRDFDPTGSGNNWYHSDTITARRSAVNSSTPSRSVSSIWFRFACSAV